MPKITREEVRVPADVMPEARDEYITNYLKATRETGRLMLFACDQKIEHLNKDFYGEGIDIADLDPEHLFKIGSEGVCGVLAGQRGLVAQYAADYPEINYLIKMNSKTNLVGTKQEDPYSPQLYDLDAVLAMKEAGVNIVGLGYTIYLGSEYEATMMAEATMFGGTAAIFGGDTAPLTVTLTDLADPAHTVTFPLDGTVSLGRDPGLCRIVLDYDPSISRHQCDLCLRGGDVVLVNQSSSNGTKVNGEKITTECPLTDGSIIKMGNVQLRLTIT